MFGEFTLIKHLAEKSLANEYIIQRVNNCNYYFKFFQFGESQMIDQIRQTLPVKTFLL